MAYAPHIRVAFGGSLTNAGDFNSSQEEWVCAINCVRRPSEAITLEDYLDEVKPKLFAWFQAVNSKMSNFSNLKFVKANDIDAAGHYADGNTTHFRDYLPPAEGQVTPTDPPFVSTAVTWTTDKQRGPGSRGRIYLPNFTLGELGTYTISQDGRTAMLAAAKSLLGVVADTPAAGPSRFIPVVASRVNATNTPITGVSVGNIKDVQRRRKNQIRETYIHVAF